MRVIALAVFLLSVFLGNAFAHVPKANIFIGYSYLSADLPNISGRQNLNGWEGSLEGKVLPFLGIVADGSGHYGPTQVKTGPVPFDASCAPGNSNLYTALFGPRVSASFHGVRPFAHFLVGAADINGVSSGVSFASAVAGGVELKLAPIIGWRFPADYIHTHFPEQQRDTHLFPRALCYGFEIETLRHRSGFEVN